MPCRMRGSPSFCTILRQAGWKISVSESMKLRLDTVSTVTTYGVLIASSL